MPVSYEDVRNAYRFVLGRDPESEAVVLAQSGTSPNGGGPASQLPEVARSKARASVRSVHSLPSNR